MPHKEKILVIKLGALGDFIQATGPMQAIRAQHKAAHITLLTTEPFEDIAQKTGYFDEIWIDEKPCWYSVFGWLRLRDRLNSAAFFRVYDLQNNDRTGLYFKLLHPKPEWVGIAKGASHRNTSPQRTAGHAFDGHVQTLEMAGIQDIRLDALEWLDEDINDFKLQSPYILLVPGSAPNRPEKRWPAQHYAQLAQLFLHDGYQVVILGSQTEKEIAHDIKTIYPNIVDLTGRTKLGHISALARAAAGAIGNDTGPMHIIAATGCVSLTIFSPHSNPVRHAPKGQNADVMKSEALHTLEAQTVFDIFTKLKKTN